MSTNTDLGAEGSFDEWLEAMQRSGSITSQSSLIAKTIWVEVRRFTSGKLKDVPYPDIFERQQLLVQFGPDDINLNVVINNNGDHVWQSGGNDGNYWTTHWNKTGDPLPFPPHVYDLLKAMIE